MAIREHELRVCRGVPFESQPQWTHREMLSKVSSLYDPLDFMVPFSMRGKMIMKKNSANSRATMGQAN